MLLKDIKNSHPQCYNIVKGNLTRFFQNRHLVEHDSEILESYLNTNRLDLLDYMESFYTLIRRESLTASYKCIMCRKILSNYNEELYEKDLEE